VIFPFYQVLQDKEGAFDIAGAMEVMLEKSTKGSCWLQELNPWRKC
jgi:hypothetical protein